MENVEVLWKNAQIITIGGKKDDVRMVKRFEVFYVQFLQNQIMIILHSGKCKTNNPPCYLLGSVLLAEILDKFRIPMYSVPHSIYLSKN